MILLIVGGLSRNCDDSSDSGTIVFKIWMILHIMGVLFRIGIIRLIAI